MGFRLLRLYGHQVYAAEAVSKRVRPQYLPKILLSFLLMLMARLLTLQWVLIQVIVPQTIQHSAPPAASLHPHILDRSPHLGRRHLLLHQPLRPLLPPLRLSLPRRRSFP
ncbi:hypothetical protein COP2_007518 [Malus domestica]